MANFAWVIPVLTLAAAVLIASFAKVLREKAAYVGLGAIGAGLVIAIGTFLQAVGALPGFASPAAGAITAATGEKLWQVQIANWAVFGGKPLHLGLMVDNLSAMMLVVVTLISFAVQLYSVSYMKGDVRFTRYYAAINLFTTGMLGLVLADNFLVLLISWEIMGLCSYLLIGHWYERPWPQMGSMKAFLTTRVGDVGLMVGIWILFFLTKSFNFDAVTAWAAANAGTHSTILTIAALFLFAGAVGKSAQFPLHTWLPDAMAGPTPGSALIHAATMVVAGVYLVARSFGIFSAVPLVLTIVALIGFFTSIFAASIATLRTDLKEVLAYSTISQLGYMIGALGVGGYQAGSYHLMTHAFFKALLFLGAGSVIHAVHTQEMHQMGGLRKKIPITYYTWMVAYLALAGFPLFSGFFSKDELLVAAWFFEPAAGFEWARWLPFIMGLATALLTAYYMTRATILTFFGKPRAQKLYDEASEHGLNTMTLPLIILAVPALLSGYLWAPVFGIDWFERFLALPGIVAPHGANPVMYLAIAATFVGIGVGYLLYGTDKVAFKQRAIKGLQPLYTLLKNKYYIDELYDVIAVKTSLLLAQGVDLFDRYVVDGAVMLAAKVNVLWADLTAVFDRNVVDGAVNGTASVARWGGRNLRRLSTGQVQGYMLTLALAVVIAVIIYQVR